MSLLRPNVPPLAGLPELGVAVLCWSHKEGASAGVRDDRTRSRLRVWDGNRRRVSSRDGRVGTHRAVVLSMASGKGGDSYCALRRARPAITRRTVGGLEMTTR